MYVDLKDRRLEYCGRIDWEGNFRYFIILPLAGNLTFSGGGQDPFCGKTAALLGINYAGAIVDGVQKKYLLRPEA